MNVWASPHWHCFFNYQMIEKDMATVLKMKGLAIFAFSVFVEKASVQKTGSRWNGEHALPYRMPPYVILGDPI